MANAVSRPPLQGLYGQDLALWCEQQARLLEERRFAELDLGNLIDEVRSVGSSERREIRNRLVVLIVHLLKWRHQPGRRTDSWIETIDEQREQIADLLSTSPSLRGYLVEALPNAHRAARLKASRETGIDLRAFPADEIFTPEQALGSTFLPEPHSPTGPSEGTST